MGKEYAEIKGEDWFPCRGITTYLKRRNLSRREDRPFYDNGKFDMQGIAFGAYQGIILSGLIIAIAKGIESLVTN